MFRTWLKENNVDKFDFSGEVIPRAKNREFWDKIYKEKYIKAAEKHLNYNWPLIKASYYIAYTQQGNRSRQEDPHFARRMALCNLVIGEVLEYKGRFIPDIVDGLLLICEETFWGVSAHKHPTNRAEQNFHDITVPYIDLFVAETAATVTMTYHLLYDEMKDYCPEIITRIEHELNYRIVQPYLTRFDFVWMARMGDWAVNNWNPWVISNILTVFLLFVKSPMQLSEGLKKMFYEINEIYFTYPKDGGCDEGTTYWGVSAGAMFEFCEQIYLATNGEINFFTDEIIQNVMKYESRAYIGNGYFVNFSDGASKPTVPMNYILYKSGKRIGYQNLCSVAKEVLVSLENDLTPEEKLVFDNDPKLRRRIFGVIYEDEILNQPDLIPEETCVLNDTENAFVRNGKWYYAAKGGNNAERHNHYDVGSFIVYHDNMPLLIDPSCGTYTKQTFSPDRYKIWTMQSGWHNTPVINGCEQTGEFAEGGGAHNKADYFALNGKTTEISFADAYLTGAEISKVYRKISAVEDAIEITDSFEFKNPENTISEHFVTPYNIEITEGKAIIDSRFVLTANIEGSFSVEYVSFEGDTKLISCWNVEGLNRIKFDFNAKSEADITFVLKEI